MMKVIRKLVLRRDMLRNLSETQLAAVRAADGNLPGCHVITNAASGCTDAIAAPPAK